MIGPDHTERHAVNIHISTELKQALREIARRNGRTMAETIRLALQTALPLMNAFWEAENRLLGDWSARQSRRRR
jgi:predicted DNA-binding protein